ncbi:MAG: dethiobiotin synthase [Actinomycetia bacterium]|nr:dethiobiotin synthase [Actinomycetes bacterium]
MRGVFITGTDTGVGKTTVTAYVAWGLRRRGIDVGVMKPIETGHGGTGWPEDARRLATAAGVDDPREWVVPYVFADPVAPWVASQVTGRSIDWEPIVEAARALAARHEVLLVEGAGGIAVPIRADATMADLASRLGLPVLVVARAQLGTLNHTVLTVHYARARGLRVVGLILNGGRGPDADLAERTNPGLLTAMTGLPILGQLPALSQAAGPPSPERLDAVAHVDWAALMEPERWGG